MTLGGLAATSSNARAVYLTGTSKRALTPAVTAQRIPRVDASNQRRRSALRSPATSGADDRMLGTGGASSAALSGRSWPVGIIRTLLEAVPGIGSSSLFGRDP